MSAPPVGAVESAVTSKVEAAEARPELFVAVTFCVPVVVAVGVKLYVRLEPLPATDQFVPTPVASGNW